MALQLCPSCKGQKQFMELGMMMIKCKPCKATGYIIVDDPTPNEVKATPTPEELVLPSMDDVKPKGKKKKAG
jgi:hypothetical protein